MNDGFVYFIKAGTEFVKIGYTKEVKGRLSSITVSSPLPISLIGVIEGGVKKEKEIQRKFKHFRVRGEWFDLSSELKEFIDTHVIEYKPPQRKGQHKKPKTRTKYYEDAGRSKMTVYLIPENLEYLKRLSLEIGISMSSLVNEMIEKERSVYETAY